MGCPKLHFHLRTCKTVLSTECKVEFDSLSAVMQFIGYPQVKYLSAIRVFSAEAFHNKREKKASSGNRWARC